MTIEYRLMNPEEMEQIFDLWLAVYPETERASWKREFLSIPGSREHTYVAVGSGNVLSTALLWIREMNNSAGIARRVGNISHVATHPKARHRGHAKQLLRLAIEKMEQENCDFSTLFTSDEARPLYEKFSWRTCPLPFWQGQLTSMNPPRSTEYSARSSDQREKLHLWRTLSDIYTEFNRARPFVIQRDLSTWESFTAHKIADGVQAGASVWLAYPVQSPEAICGYLIGHRSDQGFLIAEIGAKEGHRAAIPSLIYQVIGSYEAGQPVGGRLYLPDEPEIMTVLRQCFQPLMSIESTELMVRPINRKQDYSDFILPHSPGVGIFWLLDQI